MADATQNLRSSTPKELDEYLSGIIHGWSRTLAALGYTLIPLFFVLDYFMMPREFLLRFAIYRGVTTALIIAQYAVLRLTRPSPRSYLHGYFFSAVVGSMIALMTTDLGGFNSTYYAGLNLVLIAVNLLPWSAIHSGINSILIVAVYVVLNLEVRQKTPVHTEVLINNLYFLLSTGVIAVSINYVKHKLITEEFHLRADLKAARDALWGEMAIAKRIQTALLPKAQEVDGYKVAATMLPADQVGGDYYDVIETEAGETWLAIGDVSGHGVESGLIMMMTQTSLFTTVNRVAGQKPSEVLCRVNTVIKQNISRLGADRYMTCMALRLQRDAIHYAGKHQDILLYRARTQTAEYISNDGVWLGLVDSIDGLLPDDRCPIEEGDIVVLFTDGITEAMTESREMYGSDRLKLNLIRNAHRDVEDIVQSIVSEVRAFMHELRDDLTIVTVKRVKSAERAPSATAPAAAGVSVPS